MQWSGVVRRAVSILAIVAGAWSVLASLPGRADAETPPAPARGCPAEMARVGHYCVDRWEVSTVDKTTGEALSPYYPPSPGLVSEVWRGWLVEREQLGDEAARAMPLPPLSELQPT